MRIEAWRTDYNSVRPHSALGQLAPDQFRQLSTKNRRAH
ncbi:integrase core domain-containing protein [Burkholderia metallica]